MKTTRALLWLSLLVAVSCENSTDTTAVGINRNFYDQEHLLLALKLLKSVSDSKDLIDNMARTICSSGSINVLKKSVVANQVANEGKIDDVKSLVNSISSAILKLEGIVIGNQVTTDAEIAQLTATIKTNSDSLTSLIKGLDTTINDNQVKIEGFITELKTKMDTIYSSLKNQISGLESAVLLKLGSLDNLLSGIEANLNLDQYAYLASVILDTLTVPSCKTPGVSGVYILKNPSTKVYCEMITLDGGWLVIQQRVGTTINFNLGWTGYRNGFGIVGNKEDYWLGLENIHLITSSGKYELAIEYKNGKGSFGYALYSQFVVASEADKYRLTVGGHSGALPNCMSGSNKAQFSTPDMESDPKKALCAKVLGGGWWYNNGCGFSGLNENYINWCGNGIYSRMMIRKK